MIEQFEAHDGNPHDGNPHDGNPHDGTAAGGARAPRRRGRRPAGVDTRAQILASSRELFTTQGYDKVSLRAIARHAGVDPALVHHYFDGKPQLFIASVATIEVDPAQALDHLTDVPTGELGANIVRTFLELWDHPEAGGAFAATVRAALSGDEAVRPFQEFLTHEILRRFPLPETDPQMKRLRSQLIASQLLGLAVSRYVLKLGQLATLTSQELVIILGPTIQRYVDGPFGLEQTPSV